MTQKCVVVVAVVVVFTLHSHQFSLYGHQSSAKRRNSACAFWIRCRCVSGTITLFKKTRRSRTGDPEICSSSSSSSSKLQIINFHFLDITVVPNDVTLRALSESVVGVSQGQIILSKKRLGPKIIMWIWNIFHFSSGFLLLVEKISLGQRGQGSSIGPKDNGFEEISTSWVHLSYLEVQKMKTELKKATVTTLVCTKKIF